MSAFTVTELLVSPVQRDFISFVKKREVIFDKKWLMNRVVKNV